MPAPSIDASIAGASVQTSRGASGRTLPGERDVLTRIMYDRNASTRVRGAAASGDEATKEERHG